MEDGEELDPNESDEKIYDKCVYKQSKVLVGRKDPSVCEANAQFDDREHRSEYELIRVCQYKLGLQLIWSKEIHMPPSTEAHLHSGDHGMCHREDLLLELAEPDKISIQLC